MWLSLCSIYTPPPSLSLPKFDFNLRVVWYQLSPLSSYSGFPGSEALNNQSKTYRTSQGLKGGVVRLVYIMSFLMSEGTSLVPTGTRDYMPAHIDYDEEVNCVSFIPFSLTLPTADGKQSRTQMRYCSIIGDSRICVPWRLEQLSLHAHLQRGSSGINYPTNQPNLTFFMRIIPPYPSPSGSFPNTKQQTKLQSITPSNALQFFYHDLFLTNPSQAEQWAANTKPQSLAPYWSTTTYAAWKHIPTTFVLCEEDRCVPMPYVEAMLYVPSLVPIYVSWDVNECW